MAQVKIYMEREQLEPIRAALSETLQSCLCDALGLPPEKKFQRFFPLEPENFIHPRSEQYVILEIILFEGRSIEAKKKLITLLFERFQTQLGISSIDLEIVLLESPRHNWGIRGFPGDELHLEYKVSV
jgi:phenylpyruvate tautomerase PptA (4-oxalocrotonate tautomerase family)